MSAHEHLIDNVIVFIGGFLLSLTHPLTSSVFLFNINYLDISIFVLRALAGGALALLGKVGIEWCIKKFTKAKNRNPK